MEQATQMTQNNNLSMENSRILQSNSGGAGTTGRDTTPRSPDLSVIEDKVQDASVSQVITFSDGQISHPLLPLQDLNNEKMRI